MIINLVPDFSEDDLKREFDAFMQRIVRIIENELEQIALEAYSDAKLKTKLEGGFDDQTGNLRSSIGYAILYNGELLVEKFQQSDKGTDKVSGISVGQGYAQRLAQESPKGWTVLLVAGMEYASWVEARGYDVITGSTLGAEAKLKRAMENVLLAFK